MRTVLPDLEHLTTLVELCSSDLPSDVAGALAASRAGATGNAACIIDEILCNCEKASSIGAPMCQDTGIPAFYVGGRALDAADRMELSSRFKQVVAACVASGVLRPNAVDAITGRNSGDGTGVGIPQVHFDDAGGVAPDADLTVDLLLKGGGSENVGRQYSLPDQELGAGRDMDGVRRCVIDAAFRAQGFGCAPGVLGVCVGGDRATGLAVAKRQLLRRFDEADGPFAGFERELADAVNSLGIGPMGLGGFPTVLGVRVCSCARHPASFFVSIAYGCWALRRRRLLVSSDGRAVFI